MNLGLDFKLTSWDKLFPGLQMENIWCVCVRSWGQVSLRARCDVDALHAQDHGSRDDWRAVANDTLEENTRVPVAHISV